MNYDEMIAAGLRDLDEVIKFEGVLAGAEHTVVFTNRESETKGWHEVHEWIARASLYDRYIVWLCVAIEVMPDGTIETLESPCVHIVMLEKVHKCRDDEDGPEWECEFGEIAYDDWKEILAEGVSLAEAAGLITDKPVDRFNTFWRDTRPAAKAPVLDGMAFRAPMRFLWTTSG